MKTSIQKAEHVVMIWVNEKMYNGISLYQSLQAHNEFKLASRSGCIKMCLLYCHPPFNSFFFFQQFVNQAVELQCKSRTRDEKALMMFCVSVWAAQRFGLPVSHEGIC